MLLPTFAALLLTSASGHNAWAIAAAPDLGAAAYAFLAHVKKTDGGVTNAHVRQVAKLLGRSERTVYRWLSGSLPVGRERFELNDTERKVLAAARGSVVLMYEALEEEGNARVSLRTYQRAVAALDRSELAFFRRGDAGWRSKTIHAPQPAGYRGAVFHIDHTLLNVWLRTSARRKWVQVWLTVVIDAATRKVVGWAISLRPNEATVLATLRRAFDPTNGCIPDQMVCDNGAELIATGVVDAAAALGFQITPIDPYSPWQNGKVERFFGTLEQGLLKKLPFYADGPRGHNKRLYGSADGPLTVPQFSERLAAWVDKYNNKRIHSALGKPPAQAWAEDRTPLRQAPDPRLLDFMLMREKKPHIVRGYGIRWQNWWYYTPGGELLSYAGRGLSIRYLPYDYRRIFLFDDEKFVAEAIPWEQISDKERNRLQGLKSAQLSRLRGELPAKATALEEPERPLPIVAASEDFTSGAAEARTRGLNETLADKAAAAARPARRQRKHRLPTALTGQDDEGAEDGSGDAAERFSGLDEPLEGP